MSSRPAAEASPSGAEEAESEQPPVKLTREDVGKGLSLLGLTADSEGHAYLKLDIPNLHVGDISEISSFKHLRFVDISGNQLEGDALKPVEALPYLMTLTMSHMMDGQLSDWNVLAAQPFLQQLICDNNRCESIVGAAESVPHPALFHLSLKHNSIRSISGVAECASLRVLELRGNKLQSTAGIAGAVNLEQLYLAENELTSLEDVGSLSKLQLLHVRKNKLASVASLGDEHQLESLSYLNLRENEVATLEELDLLKGVTALRQLLLVGNPVSELEDYRMQTLYKLPFLARVEKSWVTEEERQAVLEQKQQEAEEAAAAANEDDDDDQ